MFSGIVESLGLIKEIVEDGSNKHFVIQSVLASEAYIDQSISHNGVCLTVVQLWEDRYRVTAIKETLEKTNLGDWKIGNTINLERSLQAHARIDGHFVQGHVDTVMQCKTIKVEEGSWYFGFEIPSTFHKYIVDKGSICINGVSLTVVKSKPLVEVAIIPYTFENTNFKFLEEGSIVNVEFDIFGKYIVKYLENLPLL